MGPLAIVEARTPRSKFRFSLHAHEYAETLNGLLVNWKGQKTMNNDQDRNIGAIEDAHFYPWALSESEVEVVRQMSIKKQAVVDCMADSLIEAARRENIDLKGITVENFNSFLDDAFNDGGETRCESFTDLAWPYSTQFGELGVDKVFHEAQWECIEAAIQKVKLMVE